MAKKCLERAEDIFLDIADNAKKLPSDKPPLLPPKIETDAPSGVAIVPPAGKSLASNYHSPVIRCVVY